MDIRTGNVFDPSGRELTREEADRIDQEPIKISGDNCMRYCALVFKKNCLIQSKKFRDRCICFKLQVNTNYKGDRE